MSMMNRLKARAMTRSRDGKLEHFYSLFREGQAVLDVGVSSEAKEGLPARNYFLKNYRYAPETYTGLGIQDLSGMSELFPGKRFVQYSGGRFPFPDKTFDWVFSNAVIEHVGNDDAQLMFLNEMMRVGDQVFFTTPSKFFPVESHTNVLFLHWNDDLFYTWRKRRKPSCKRYDLNLLSARRLRRLLELSNAASSSLYRNRFFGASMTYTVVCTDKADSRAGACAHDAQSYPGRIDASAGG